MPDKPNCYKCKWRQGVPGDAHSSCHHPVTGGAHDDPLMELLSILGSVGRGPGATDTDSAAKLGITANPHGIRHGWFQWPYNFDPVWLETCEGFEAKEKDAPEDK
jgi:hypothetical protein